MTKALNNIGIYYEETGDTSVYVSVVRMSEDAKVMIITANDDDEAAEKASYFGAVLYLDSITNILNSAAVAMAMTEMEKATGGRYLTDQFSDYDAIVDQTAANCSICNRKVYLFDLYYGTPCETYCMHCMDKHIDECALCSIEFGDKFNQGYVDQTNREIPPNT